MVTTVESFITFGNTLESEPGKLSICPEVYIYTSSFQFYNLCHYVLSSSLTQRFSYNVTERYQPRQREAAVGTARRAETGPVLGSFLPSLCRQCKERSVTVKKFGGVSDLLCPDRPRPGMKIDALFYNMRRSRSYRDRAANTAGREDITVGRNSRYFPVVPPHSTSLLRLQTLCLRALKQSCAGTMWPRPFSRHSSGLLPSWALCHRLTFL